MERIDARFGHRSLPNSKSKSRNFLRRHILCDATAGLGFPRICYTSTLYDVTLSRPAAGSMHKAARSNTTNARFETAQHASNACCTRVAHASILTEIHVRYVLRLSSRDFTPCRFAVCVLAGRVSLIRSRIKQDVSSVAKIHRFHLFPSRFERERERARALGHVT